jgi:SAM-dependent methyltransferase
MSVNVDQTQYWNEGAGPVWAAMQAALDRQLAPLGDAALSALAPRAGEAILDIGCGCGQTTWALAAIAGPGGKVVGVDISTPMLAVARTRADGAIAPSFLQLDAGTADLGTAAFDAVFSRFGVMFFDEPAAAFANIRQALKPGGRLAFVCWRPMGENPMFTAPGEAAAPFLPAPEPFDSAAPGPFAFADSGRVRSILAAAGFRDIAVESFDTSIGGADLDGATSLALQVGPLARALREHPELEDRIRPAVQTRLADFQIDGRVSFPAAVWIVAARV